MGVITYLTNLNTSSFAIFNKKYFKKAEFLFQIHPKEFVAEKTIIIVDHPRLKKSYFLFPDGRRQSNGFSCFHADQCFKKMKT
jgi:hypothetical protein